MEIMRKRYPLASGERSLGLRLSKLAAPALWLGLAPFLACTAHAPEHAPCTVYDFEDANSRCARPDGIYPIGYEPGPPPAAPPPRSEIRTSRPETAAGEIKRALEGCDRVKLWDAVLGYEGYSSLVKTPVAQNAYAEMIKECLATYLHDICPESFRSEAEDEPPTPVKTHPRLSEPKIEKVIAVRAAGEWKHPFTMVTIALVDQEQTPPKARPPILLVQVNGDWWILPKVSSR